MLRTALPEGILGPQREAVRFVDRRGEPLRFELADRRYHYQRFSLDDCPEHFIHATLAAEDKRYWSHGGIDLLATLRAAKDYLVKGRVVSGASTITQQLIKVAQPRSRTISAKLTECLKGGFADSTLFQILVPRMLAGVDEPFGHVKTVLKDVETALDLGYQSGTTMPMTAAAAQIYRLLEAQGHAFKEPTFLYDFYGGAKD